MARLWVSTPDHSRRGMEKATMERKVVAVLGTLDSKGVEFAFLKARLAAEGVNTLVIDAGVLGPPAFPPDVAAAEVANAGGVPLDLLAAERDRGHAMAV